MQKKSLLFIIFSHFIFFNTSEALTPKQYCEKLHSKRPSGTNTSHELLNVEYINDKLVNYDSVVCLCRNGTWGTPTDPLYSDCDAPCAPVGRDLIHGTRTNITFTYYIVTIFKKECKNGNFLYKKETTKNYFGPLPFGETQSSSICEGTGC